jgi:hypothetical protein
MRKEPQIYRYVRDLLNAKHSIGIKRFSGLYRIHGGAEKIRNRSVPQKCELTAVRMRQLWKLGKKVLQIPVNLFLPIGRHHTHLSVRGFHFSAGTMFRPNLHTGLSLYHVWSAKA